MVRLIEEGLSLFFAVFVNCQMGRIGVVREPRGDRVLIIINIPTIFTNITTDSNIILFRDGLPKIEDELDDEESIGDGPDVEEPPHRADPTHRAQNDREQGHADMSELNDGPDLKQDLMLL